MKKLATNLFIDGLVTDFHPLTAKNTTLTNALNATLVTVKGNEMVLLNDFGNIKIQYTENNELKYVQLKDGFIPVGIKEYGGIIYIASYKPEKRDLNNILIEKSVCELGSFPSIPWTTSEGTPIPKETKIPLEYKYRPFHNLKEGNDFKDFTTNKLNFELTNPVNIEILSSYDGTVNLILNDDRNIPRLINSGFAITEDGQAFIPEKTDANTEYLEEHFDATTSLIKRVVEFPEIIYDGVLNAGNLAVGNYTLYFKYADADGNETDFIAQSGLVSIFKGKDSDPFSIDGGVEDMNSNKAMLFTIKSTDFSYPYIKVYYTRTSSAIDSDRIPQAYVIDKLFEISREKNSVTIIITGDETKTQVPLSEINTSYFVSDTVKAQAQCLNMLFLGNVTTLENNYKLFEDVSLRIIPRGQKVESVTKIGYINPDTYLDTSGVTDNDSYNIYLGEYYNTKNIYYNVGYWNEEYYRLGIVYVLEDDTKTPVFNIAGCELTWNQDGSISTSIANEDKLINFPLYKYCEEQSNTYKFLKSTNDDKIVIPAKPNIETEFNNKGVIHFKDLAEDDSYVYNIQVYLSKCVKAQLVKLKVKGFFIVRLKRIPTIACQGYTLPWDKEAKVPIMTYYGHRGGTLDSKADDDELVASPGDASAKEFFQIKRQYFVESFLRLVGKEESSLDDLELWSLLGESYYSQLHYIPDWLIDAKMIDANFGGEPNYINENTQLTRLFPMFMIVTYSENQLEQEYLIHEEATAILRAVLSDIKSYLNPNYEEITDSLFTQQGNNLYKSYLAAYKHLSEGKTIAVKGVADYNYSNIIGDAYDTVNSPLCDIYTWNIISPIENYTYEWYKVTPTVGGVQNNEIKGTYEECLTALNNIIRDIHDSSLTISWNAELYLTTGEDVDTEGDPIPRSFLYENTITGVLPTEIPSVITPNISISSLGGYVSPSLGYSINDLRLLFHADEYSFSKKPISDVSYPVRNYHLNRIFGERAEDITLDYGRVSSIKTHQAKHYYDLYKYCDGKQLTAICPEFEVRQHYFNTLFTGSKFTTKYTKYQPGYLKLSDVNLRRYYTDVSTINIPYFQENLGLNKEFKIVSVTDNVPIVAIDNTIFKSVIGSDMEAYRFAYINEEHCESRLNYRENRNGEDSDDFNLVRGIYSPYLGIVSNDVEFRAKYGYFDEETKKNYNESYDPSLTVFNQCKIFNIYYDTPTDFKSAFPIRAQDKSAYYAISDINKLVYSEENDLGTTLDVYRGDCFLCTFTHRLNRNFNDPTAPTNDHILDKFTWLKNYKPDTLDNGAVERLNRINRGDVNAVKLGSWVTIKVKSSYNLSIRSLDESHIQEKGVMGRARGFYPLQLASADGGFKIPNSYVINDAFGATLGELYENLMDAIYINTDYSNRVVYSDIDITSQFKNGYRIFKGGHTKDYTKQYGAITKLIERAGDIVCVFEHGVGLLKINEKAIAAESDGGLTYITANTVLPETPFIYSDMYGSQWAESVIKTPSGVIYGIDTARKKIWKLASNFTIISDFRIEEFLHNNLIIGETDVLPYLGLKNIATHYNANKSDVMFTFYYKPFIMESTKDCDTGEIVYEKPKNFDKTEIAWNICYNEILDKFQTFYSWIPIASANIDNQFYSFDRLCSRELLVNLELLDWPISPDRESPKHQFPIKTPYLWKHGQFNGDKPLPTNWYGEQHPFEFEFVVNEEIGVQKIFNNLVIISNKAEPESFHFTITGDSYEFSEDKPTMYYRLEATKELFNSLGSLINYDKEYTNLKSKLKRNPKSTILPLYYNRVNHYNDIYDIYTKMLDRTDSRDYSELSGTEVIWNKYLNEFELSTHIKNSPMESTNLATLRGNSRYKEDRWEVLIPSLNLMLKNEVWLNDVPPIVINPNVIASDLLNTVIERTGLPNTYAMGDIDTTGWTFRKQTKIRDKYCKVKIRYSGTKLAVISAIITTFTISYA